MKKITFVLAFIFAVTLLLSSCSMDWLLAQRDTETTEEVTTHAEGERYVVKVDDVNDFDENDNFIVQSSENRYVYANNVFGGYKVYKFNVEGQVYEIEEVNMYDDMKSAIEAYEAGIDGWTEDVTINYAELHKCCIVFSVNPIASDTYRDFFNITKEQLEAAEVPENKQ